MFENRLVKLCFASNPYKLTKIYSVCRKHTFGRVRRDDLITKVNGYNWQFLPWYYFFSSQFLYRSLIQLYTDFPACCALFFSKIIEEGCVRYNKKHRFPNLYKYICSICIYTTYMLQQSRKHRSEAQIQLCVYYAKRGRLKSANSPISKDQQYEPGQISQMRLPIIIDVPKFFSYRKNFISSHLKFIISIMVQIINIT